MTSSEEQPVCICGQPMVPLNIGSPYSRCMNCDTIQPSEYSPDPEVQGKRVQTIADRRFESAWASKLGRIWPDQGRKAA